MSDQDTPQQHNLQVPQLLQVDDPFYVTRSGSPTIGPDFYPPKRQGALSELEHPVSRRKAGSWRVAREKTRQFFQRAKSLLDTSLLARDNSDEDDWLTTDEQEWEKFVRALVNKKRRKSSQAAEADEAFDACSFRTCSDVPDLPLDSVITDNRRPSLVITAADDDDDVFGPDRTHLSVSQQHKIAATNPLPDYFILDPNCAVHGRRRKTKLIHFEGEYPEEILKRLGLTQATSVLSLSSEDYLTKFTRLQRRMMLTPAERDRQDKERSKLQRSLITIGMAFLFLFTAFQGMQNLQTTINHRDGMGAISLSVVYLGMVASCLFLPPYMLNRLGCKITLAVCMTVYALYMLVNFSPRWYSLVPMSFFLGIAAAPLWAAKCTYLTAIGLRYAYLNMEDGNEVVVRFFGIFYMVLYLGQVFGNIISSKILHMIIAPPPLNNTHEVQTSCGHFYAPDKALSVQAATNLADPSAQALRALCGIYFSCTVVAVLIIVVFLNQLRQDYQILKEKPRFKLEIFHETVKCLKRPKYLLLVPITVFNGMEQAFIVGEYTKAYVGCCLGMANIGYIMTCFGVCNALCCLVFGPLIKLFGRMPLLMFGAVVDMLMIFTLLVWPPNAMDSALFYVLAGCWGMADGVWNTQINGLWGCLFDHRMEVSVASYRLWESVGFIIAFLYTPFTSTATKLYVLLTVLLIGMAGYGLIETYDHVARCLQQVKPQLRMLLHDALPTNKKIQPHYAAQAVNAVKQPPLAEHERVSLRSFDTITLHI